jgi:hypothetical protein
MVFNENDYKKALGGIRELAFLRSTWGVREQKKVGNHWQKSSKDDFKK